MRNGWFAHVIADGTALDGTKLNVKAETTGRSYVEAAFTKCEPDSRPKPLAVGSTQWVARYKELERLHREEVIPRQNLFRYLPRLSVDGLCLMFTLP